MRSINTIDKNENYLIRKNVSNNITSKVLKYSYNMHLPELKDINKKIKLNSKVQNCHSNNNNLMIEILRSRIINNLIKLFTIEISKFKTIIKANVLNKIFKYNKLNDLVQKWCWMQYYNKNLLDDVIPYVTDNKYYFDDFLKDFNYILNTNIDLSNNIIKKLKQKVISFLYKSHSTFYTLATEKYIYLPETYLCVTQKDNDVIFKIVYSSIIDKIFDIKNNKNLSYLIELYKHQTIMFEISININLYRRLYDKFIIHSKIKTLKHNIDNYIFCLIFRYFYIDSGNQQLAIDKKIKDIFKPYIDFELYGSAINVLSNNYCSLFYDIERYFGSKGNFFNIELKQGIYWCNPPYDNTIMSNTAKKIINILQTNINIAFVITIPIWDSVTKNKSHTFEKVIKNYNLNSIANHNDYEIYALLKPYIKSELIIPKKRIPYFNHRLNTPIYAVDTYMLIIYDKIEYVYIKPILTAFDQIIELDQKNYFNT